MADTVKPYCKVCNDHGFVKISGTGEIVPCPNCNSDGQDDIDD